MTEDDLNAEPCNCDFVQRLMVGGQQRELHHVIPDDGAAHATELACPCGPDVERIADSLTVVDHRDWEA